MKKFSILIIIALFNVQCKDSASKEERTNGNNSTANTGIEQMDWVLGRWENEEDGMVSKEIWKRKSNNALSGFSFRLMGKDTVFAEKMMLKEDSGGLQLSVTTVGDSKEEAVWFSQIDSPKGQFIFENTTQEFPKRIVYTHPRPNQLHVWIEGEVLGEKKRLDFHFQGE